MVKARGWDICPSLAPHRPGNLLVCSESWSPLGQPVPTAVVEGNEMEEIKDGMPDEQQVLELGIMLGQRRAFGMVAGRCSAAQAECLRQVRDEKTYLKFAANWAEFCERQLKIGKRTADRAIALLKQHGTSGKFQPARRLHRSLDAPLQLPQPSLSPHPRPRRNRRSSTRSTGLPMNVFTLRIGARSRLGSEGDNFERFLSGVD